MREAEVERLARDHADIRIHGGPEALRRHEARRDGQLEMWQFVTDHNISCFKCGTRFNDWAKTGTTNGRAWAICVQCVRSRAATVPPAPQNPANSDV